MTELEIAMTGLGIGLAAYISSKVCQRLRCMQDKRWKKINEDLQEYYNHGSKPDSKER